MKVPDVSGKREYARPAPRLVDSFGPAVEDRWIRTVAPALLTAYRRHVGDVRNIGVWVYSSIARCRVTWLWFIGLLVYSQVCRVTWLWCIGVLVNSQV